MRKLVVALVAIGTLVVAPSAAQASACPDEPPPSQAFLGFGDSDAYFLAPGGAFDAGGPAWVLGGGAAVDDEQLVLPAGSIAISPPICVSKGYPHGRMFGAATGNGPRAKAKAEVAVDVIYRGTRGRSSSKLKFRGGQLAPSDRFALDESAFGLDPITGTASIRLVLSSRGQDAAVLDDVYIDPRARN